MPAFYITPSQFWQGNDGQWSTHSLQIGPGTPSTIDVLVSTGQPIIYAVDNNAVYSCQNVSSDCLTDRGGGVDPTSKTFTITGTDYKLVDIEQNQPLPEIQNTDGLFGYDQIGLGYAGAGLPSLSHQLMGIFYTEALWLGLFGILPYTFSFNNATNNVPSYLQTLKSKSTIESLSWGYQAGAIYRQGNFFASLVFGGYDANRFQPSGVSFTMNSDETRYLTVGLKSLEILQSKTTTDVISAPINVTLDSTLPYMWLPPSACKVFEDTFSLTYDESANMYFVSQTAADILNIQQPSLRFTLTPDTSKSGDTVEIELPYAAFNLTASPPLANNKQYFPLKQSSDSGSWQLGRVFFQEIYLIADFERGNFSVNPVVWNPSLGQDIQSISASGDGATPTPISGSSGSGGGGSNAGAIAGGVVGGILGLALIAALAWFLLRRRRKQAARAHELSADDHLAGGAPPSYAHGDVPMHQRSEMEAKSKLPGELAAGVATGRDTPVYSEHSPLNAASANEMDANVYYELPSQQAIPDRFNDRDLSPHAAAIAAANADAAPSTAGAPTVSDPTEAAGTDVASPHDTAFPLSTPGSEGTGEILGAPSPDARSGIVSPVSAAPRQHANIDSSV